MEEKDIDPKTIRTYEGDIADAIQHRQTSQASIVVAAEEKKHREEQQGNVVIVNDNDGQKNHNSWIKNTLMIVISLLLLAAGIFVAYYFYTISPLSVRQPSTVATNPSTVTIASIVTPDVQKIVDVTGQSATGIVSQIEKESTANPLQNGGILEIVLGQQATTTQNGKTTSVLNRVTGPEFISMMGIQPPSSLTSSLSDQWMLGIYSSSSTTAPFIILTENFFQNAFAGMLSWEPTMPSDVSAFFQIQPAQWSEGSFHDKLIKNKNVREFTDNSGNVLLLYSFIDNNTLVIAQSEAALGEIITRFENQAYVR